MHDKPKGGLFGRLSRTRDNFSSGLSNLFRRSDKLDDTLLEELEDQLIMADIGVQTSSKIINDLREKARLNTLQSANQLLNALTQQITHLLQAVEQPLATHEHKPFVILMVGVNGVGKTTTTAKLAQHFKQNDKKVMLAAADTYRAAAIEQLQNWGTSLDIPVIAQTHNSDAAAVAYEAYQSALSHNIDVLIIDTAGRQHTHGDLMAQLAKMTRVLQKSDSDLPHEVMLTVDAATGQNALSQIHHFNELIGVSGLSITKLDGTAKGGILIAIAEKYGIPIRFIGVGESIQDLKPFVAQQFVQALLPDSLNGTSINS